MLRGAKLQSRNKHRTNQYQAIKFTRSEPRREISVSLDASILARPSETTKDVEWFPSKASKDFQDLTLAPDWGTGQQ
jgi:hypothetical protein